MIYQLDNTALMYVATSFTDGATKDGVLGNDKGALLLKKVGEAFGAKPGARLAFQYRGPKNTVLRSVIFSSDVVKYAKMTTAESMRIPLKSVKLSVTAADAATPSTDYMVRISIPQAFSLNPNETLIKDAVYHSKAGDTMGHVLAGIAYNLVKSQNEYTSWRVFKGNVEITKSDLKGSSMYEYAESNKDLAEITVRAVWDANIEWQLKYKEVQVPVFYVSACILGEYSDLDIEEGGSGWITIEKEADNTADSGRYVANGYETANREMWYLVSNGDYSQDSRLFYRTETVTDPTKEYNYINIHVTENSEKGIASGMNEKDIIIASTEDLTEVKTALESFGIIFS